MGADYNSKVFIGSIVEAEYEKLPKKVLEEFEDDCEISEGSFSGLHHYVNYDDDFDVGEYKVVEDKQDNQNKKVQENDNIKQIPAYKWIYGKLRIEAYDANNKTSSKAEIKNLVKGDEKLEKLYSDFTKGFAKNYQKKFNDKQNLKEQARDIVKTAKIKFDNSAITNKRKGVKEKNRGFFGFFK